MYKQSQTYIADIKDLKKKNSELYDEVKNLKDNPIVITKIKTETVYKNIYMRDTILLAIDDEHPNRFVSEMKYDDKWCKIRGVSEYDLDSMLSSYRIDTISFPFTTPLVSIFPVTTFIFLLLEGTVTKALLILIPNTFSIS